MAKTNTQFLIGAGKRIATWLTDRMKSAAPAPSCNDIMTRIHAQYPGPNFSVEDQIVIGRTALIQFKQRDAKGWARFRDANPDVQDRPISELKL